jgi:hypothetical protein
MYKIVDILLQSSGGNTPPGTPVCRASGHPIGIPAEPDWTFPAGFRQRLFKPVETSDKGEANSPRRERPLTGSLALLPPSWTSFPPRCAAAPPCSPSPTQSWAPCRSLSLRMSASSRHTVLQPAGETD